MTLKDNIRLTLRKHPHTRHSRGEFAWYYGVELNEFHYFATEIQFKTFFQNWAGVERAYREILKEPEFLLPIKEEAKRYEKSAEFRAEYKKQ